MRRPYTGIACCIDRDDMAEVVLAEGTRLADGDATSLRIVHVIAPPRAFVAGALEYAAPVWEVRSDVQAWLEGVARGIPGSVPVLLEGASPARQVVAWAPSERIELIVASANRGMLERAILGGFASHLAYHAPCAVLLVHPPDSGGAPRAGADEGARAAGGSR